MAKYRNVLDFWFGPLENSSHYPVERSQKWFEKDLAFDDMIRRQFSDLYRQAFKGELEDWTDESRSSLALILILDQFSRNLFRHSKQAFQTDKRGLEVSEEMISKKWDRELYPVERIFCYLPFMHSEDLKVQEKSIVLYDDLRNSAPDEIKSFFENSYRFAIQHYDIVKKFERFPHRNQLLDRSSTEEEMAFLKTEGSHF